MKPLLSIIVSAASGVFLASGASDLLHGDAASGAPALGFGLAGCVWAILSDRRGRRRRPA